MDRMTTASTNLENQSYLHIWAAELEAKGWDKQLSSENSPTSSHIRIFDIAPSGSVSEWQIDLPELHQLTLDWARINRDALCTNGRNDETRLVVFEQASRFWAQELVGVHYGIEPAFFRDIAHSYAVRHSPAAWKAYDQRMPGFQIGCSSQHLNLGYGWTCKILRSDQSVQAGPKNIIVVSAERTTTSPSAVTLLDQTVSISYRMPSLDTWLAANGCAIPSIDRAEVYAAAIRKRPLSFLALANKEPLMFLLPVLEIHFAILCGNLADEERWLRIGKGEWRRLSNIVEDVWHRLRMLKHDGAGPLDCLRQYDSDHYESQTQKREEYAILSKRLDSVMRQICRTEELAHDYLQAHVGWSSLEESRTSIRCSKVALEESKRTKIVTVLAIFFVPISLSTSIFGMNINELNAEGQSFRVFIVTTISIFAATLLIWGLMYQCHKWKSLPEAPNGEWSEKKPRSETEDEPYSPVAWQVRLRQFSRLLWHGHINWAWQSGIGFSLLTSGRKGFHKSCSDHHECSYALEDLSYGAQEYLEKHVDYGFIDDVYNPCHYIVGHLDQGTGFDSSKLEVV